MFLTKRTKTISGQTVHTLGRQRIPVVNSPYKTKDYLNGFFSTLRLRAVNCRHTRARKLWNDSLLRISMCAAQVLVTDLALIKGYTALNSRLE